MGCSCSVPSRSHDHIHKSNKSLNKKISSSSSSNSNSNSNSKKSDSPHSCDHEKTNQRNNPVVPPDMSTGSEQKVVEDSAPMSPTLEFPSSLGESMSLHNMNNSTSTASGSEGMMQPLQPKNQQQQELTEEEVEASGSRFGGLDGGYHVIRSLGNGSCGAVILASSLRPQNDHYVAIKRARPDMDARLVAKEIEALKACISCPNIVQFKDSFSDPDTHLPVIVTEYVEGHCWGSSYTAERIGPLPNTPESIENIQAIFRDVLRGIMHLHEEAGLAHMDIKPENIMIQENGGNAGAKIIDLGSCVPANTLTYVRNGTLYFGAPEKLLATPAAPYCPKKADIWALGITGLVVIFGDPTFPFDTQCSSKREFRYRVCVTEITVPAMLGDAPTPQDLKDFLQSMVRRNPSHRPSARALMGHPFLVNKTIFTQ